MPKHKNNKMDNKKKETNGLTAAQRKLPKPLQEAILKKQKKNGS
jgi:hypothetical protein